MDIELTWKTTESDSFTLSKGSRITPDTRFTLFDAHHRGQAGSITKTTEKDAIKWFLNSDGLLLLLNELEIDEPPFIDQNVARPIIENSNEKPGDIDILICERHDPKFAIALQVKPVPVITTNTGEDDYKKIQKIKDGVLQVNAQRKKLGFYKNYLAILILADGRDKNATNVLFRGPSSQTFNEIYSFPQRESLHEDVGLIFMKMIQPTGKRLSDMAHVGIHYEKTATPLKQTPELTRRVKEHMRQKGF